MKLASLGPFVAQAKPDDEGAAELAADAIAEEQQRVLPIAGQSQGSGLASRGSTQNEKEPRLTHLVDFLEKKKKQREVPALIRLRLKKIQKFKAFEGQQELDLAREMGYSKKI